MQFCIGSSGRRSLPSHGVTTSIINITKDDIESSYDSDGAILSRDNSSGSADDVMWRSAGDVKVCESCCNTKLCNNAGCGATGRLDVLSSRGLVPKPLSIFGGVIEKNSLPRIPLFLAHLSGRLTR